MNCGLVSLNTQSTGCGSHRAPTFDGLRCFGRYEGSVPPPAGHEVFLVLQNGLLTRLGVTINAIDTVCHHPHKVLQGLQIVRVSAGVASCVSV